MKFSPLLDNLIKELQIMPGIGPRSAQRIAFSLLDRDREGALRLSKALEKAAYRINYCSECRSYCEGDLCEICKSETRQSTKVLCVVESPSDVLAIEKTAEFSGTYFVLHGHLNPLEGIGPRELHLDILEGLIDKYRYKEIILATNPTVEGDATAHFIGHIAAKYQIPVSQIARGIPMGGELDAIDGSTLMRSLAGRRPL
ncbi:MAG: recombination protein RecR [Succinimonas sp.]|nr:recombination protein RecR [Succinimonas sp.]